MITALLLSVLLGTTATVVLIIYLIDRINRLEQASRLAQLNQPAAPSQLAVAQDNGFLGFQGKALWDVMCGKVPEGFNPDDLIALKPRYEQVIQKHIDTIFSQGKADAENGIPSKNPSPGIILPMLRGEVRSWLPPANVAVIYKIGYEFANAREDQLNYLATSLDETVGDLFARVEITLGTLFSTRLLTPNESESGSGTDTAIEVAKDD